MTRLVANTTVSVGLLALCVGTCCGSAAQAKKGPRYNVRAVSPSGEDVAVESVKVNLDLDGQGKLTRSEDRQLKLFTENAVDEYSDPRVVHDAVTQKLEVTTAATTMVDGTVVDTKKNGINETLPDAFEHAPAYTSHRETVVTHVGVERLATIHLAYRVTDVAARPYPLQVEVPVAFPGPAREVTVQVTVPEGSKLSHECLGCKAQVSESSQGGRKTMTWTFASVPAFHAESGHAPGGTPVLGQPRLVLSDAASWNQVAGELEAQMSTALEQSKQVTEKARSLTADAPTIADKVELVTAFVTDAIGTIHYDMSVLGWRAATADEVLSRGYGHTLDKAVLLTAMLRALGLKPQVILVSRDHSFAAAVPSLAQFAEAMVRVEVNGAERWLAVDGHPAGAARARLAGRWAFDPKTGTPTEIAGLPAEANSTFVGAELTVGEDLSAKGKAVVTLTGTANPYASLRANEKGPDSLAGQVAALVVPGGRADKHTLRSFDATRTSMDVELSSGPAQWESDRFLRLPVPDGPAYVAESISDLAREERATPLVIGSAMVQRSRTTWRLPKSLSLRAVPAAVEVKNEVGRFALTVDQKPGQVTVTRELTIADGWIAPERYPALRALLAAAKAPAGRVVIVERALP